LGNVDFTSIHKLEDGCEVVEWDVLEDNDGVLGWVLFQQGLEVGGARREDHLVGLAGLPVTGQGHVCERLLVPEVLERRDHVGLEIVPAEAKLLLVTGHCVCFVVVVALKSEKT